MGALEVSLAQMAGRLDVDLEKLGDKLGDRIGVMIQSLDQALSGSASQIEELTKELEATEARMTARLAELSVDGTLDQAIGRLEAALDQQVTGASGLEAQIAETEKALAGRDAQVLARDRFSQIVGDLSTAGFVRYLLDSERQRLAELGSDHFQRLSSGRYRFATDGSFDIVDLTAADALRRADSLSGGETFLASLGLALALAELVSRTGGRLDAFFLDEGFGSLDPEHLDLAMEGIEAVAAGATDRLVIVVSHVAELRERLEDLIQLERDPVSGNTRVLRA
jgi:exonuclease SbcC